jgi:peptidoglycan/LPS O-acetylase OafA/YrhL
MLFHTITSPAPGLAWLKTWAGTHNRLVLLLVVAGIISLTQIGASKVLSDQFPWLPTHVLISILFACAVGSILMSAKPSPIYVNRFMCKLGEVSFSAYLVHWAVLDAFRRWGGQIFDLDASGFSALVWFAIIFPLVVLITFGISSITYKNIERPFIDIGKRLAPRQARMLTEHHEAMRASGLVSAAHDVATPNDSVTN